jgi:hypothetical protein
MNPPVFFGIIISVERSFVEMTKLWKAWKTKKQVSHTYHQFLGKAKKQLFHIPTKPEIFKCRL